MTHLEGETLQYEIRSKDICIGSTESDQFDVSAACCPAAVDVRAEIGLTCSRKLTTIALTHCSGDEHRLTGS